MPSCPQSICIVRLSALGDVLMLVPLIKTLQANLDNTTITWIISRPAYDLVENLPGVEFIVIEKPKSLYDYWQFAKKMRSRRFDILLATQASFRANLLYPLIKARRKIGYDRIRAKDFHQFFIDETITPGREHTLESFLKFAVALGCRRQIISWELPIRACELAWAKAHLPADKNPIFLLNPAASVSERNWPTERYIEIIHYVQKHWNAHVFLIGGPQDIALATEISHTTHAKSLVGKTNLKQLLAVIQQGSVLMCPDTGPSHMACAVGTPVIALHAVTSAKVSGPYCYRHLAVDCYPQAAKAILGKEESLVVWGTHAHGLESMRLVTVSAVIARVDKVLHDLGFLPAAVS